MSQRHPVQNEAPMFVTTNTFQRNKFFADPSFAREAVECIYRVQSLYPFFLFAFVIMPDHCHFLLNVPAPGSISKIMNSYKTALVKSIGIKKLWQPRFFLDLPNNSGKTLEYIHLNPVRAKLAEGAEEYPWSSASGKWDVMELETR